MSHDQRTEREGKLARKRCERAKLPILFLIVSLRKISFVIKRVVQVDVSRHITVITKRNVMVLIIGN